MEQAPARSNKTTTYIASGTLIFATLSLFSNIMIGLPVMAAIALGGFITARQVPKSFDLLKKDLKHLAGSFVSHIKEDAGRFKHWTKNNALTRLLKRGVKNAKKNVQSIATSDTTVSKPLDANASSKPAFTGNAAPGMTATKQPAATAVPAVLKNLPNQ